MGYSQNVGPFGTLVAAATQKIEKMFPERWYNYGMWYLIDRTQHPEP